MRSIAIAVIAPGIGSDVPITEHVKPIGFASGQWGAGSGLLYSSTPIPMTSSCRLHLWPRTRQRHRSIYQTPEPTISRLSWSLGGLSLSEPRIDGMTTQQDVAQSDEHISPAEVLTSSPRARPV